MNDLLQEIRETVIEAARDLQETARDFLGAEDDATDDTTEDGHAFAVKPANIDPTGDPDPMDRDVLHATVGTLGAVHPTPRSDKALVVRLEQHPNGWHVHSETAAFRHTVHPHVEDAELFVRHRARQLGTVVLIERHPLHDDALPENRVDMAHGVQAPVVPALDEEDHGPATSREIDPTLSADLIAGR